LGLLREDEGGEEMRPIALLLLSVVSASIGQVMFKKGLLMMGEITLKSSIIGELFKMIFHPLVLSGLILYVVSTILWLLALSKTTLNFAYPFTALTFILVMLSSRLVFLESIPTLRYFGIALIVLGILLSSVAKG
jgi:drug/metabolite transporter (DMT)-like permease